MAKAEKSEREQIVELKHKIVGLQRQLGSAQAVIKMLRRMRERRGMCG